MIDVSVCIVNWNTRELLRNCLRSAELKTHNIAYEIIVVDNDSADGSAAMVVETFPRVTLIASKTNLGFARASNLAATKASGEYILYLNPDTELVTNAFLGMWNALKENPSYGAVGCRLLNSDESVQLTCASAFPSPRNELSSLLFLDRLFPNSRLCSSRELNYWDHRDSRAVECLSGACMMLRRSLVEKLGGFDEELFMYGEDLDLCFRVSQEGLALYYLASEVIFHHEGAASKKKGRSFAPVLQRAANYYFLRKNFGRTRAVAYRTAVLVGSGARLVAATLAIPLWILRRGPGQLAIPTFLGKYGDLFLWSIGVKDMPYR